MIEEDDTIAEDETVTLCDTNIVRVPAEEALITEDALFDSFMVAVVVPLAVVVAEVEMEVATLEDRETDSVLEPDTDALNDVDGDALADIETATAEKLAWKNDGPLRLGMATRTVLRP